MAPSHTAPSQHLRYEWSDRYRFRMQHPSASMLLVCAPTGIVLSLAAIALMWLTVGNGTYAVFTVFMLAASVGGLLLSTRVAMGQGRALKRERMRFAAFLREADARCGWWFLRDYAGSAHIVGRSVTDHGDWPPQLLEPLDPAKEAHCMAMRDEIARLRGIALECDRTSSASRETAGEIEVFLAPAATPA